MDEDKKNKGKGFDFFSGIENAVKSTTSAINKAGQATSQAIKTA